MVRSVFERFVTAYEEFHLKTKKKPTKVKMIPELFNNLLAVPENRWRNVGLQAPMKRSDGSWIAATRVQLTENVVTGDFEFVSGD